MLTPWKEVIKIGQVDEDKSEWIYTKTIRLKNGKILYAHNYGLKVFKFPKPDKPKEADKPAEH